MASAPDTVTGPRALWRHVPNAISLARLAATPVLATTIFRGDMSSFTWLLLACLLSDIADGLIARAFDLRSQLGAQLDSIADAIVMILAYAGVWVFQRPFLDAHLAPIVALAVLYVGEVAGALWRYGRLSSFHTLLSRIAAYAQGIFLVSLFFWGYQAWLFVPMVAIAMASLIEELLLLYLLPTWTSDVGGLYRLRQKL